MPLDASPLPDIHGREKSKQALTHLEICFRLEKIQIKK